MGLVLADAGVRAQGRGDRHVPGELGQQPGMESLVVGDLAEADPAVEDGRANGRGGVVGVGGVDDPEVASGHSHVVGLAVIGPRHCRRALVVLDQGRGAGIEEQRAGGTAAAVLE